MKIHWFHLMPYRWLPDDFREQHRSVWVDIPSSLWDSRKGHHLYNEYLDELEFAERMGVDGICVNEHHSNGYGLMPSPNVMAACLAQRTSRANLVVLGNSLALYNLLTGGRFVGRAYRFPVLLRFSPGVTVAFFFRSASSVFASCKSFVSNPSVNQLSQDEKARAQSGAAVATEHLPSSPQELIEISLASSA